MIKAPVLVFPNFAEGFILETDASGLSLGAVLSQKQLDGKVAPIAYASQTLQQYQKNYGISELKALAVVWVARHFRAYLYGHPCDVITDHETLQGLLNTPHPSGKLARWKLALQELDLKIHYLTRKIQQLCRCIITCPTGNQKGGETMVAIFGTLQVQVRDGIWQRDREQIHNWDQSYSI